MAFNWFARKRSSSNRIRRQSGDQGHRRRLTLERLEDRSLLSVNLPTMLAPSTAFYAPLFPGQSTTDVATQIQVVMPQNVPNGAPVNVGLVALDAGNHPVSSFSDTADITSSDPNATLSASSVTFKGGFATLQVTFATEGSQTVTATDVSALSLIGTGTTNVGAPDVATHLALMLPPTVGEGQSVKVGVAALDAQNHVVLSYTGTDSVSASDNAATLSATSLTFTGGTASFQATFGTLGSQTLTVTDNNTSSITGTISTIVAAPAVATHFAVQLPPNSPDGAPVNVAIVALDANNHPVPSYSGTASVSTSDAKGTLSATSVTFQQGIASLQATFVTPGTQTVTATDTSNSSLTGTGSTNVATPDVATHFGLLLPPNVPIGMPVTVGIVPLDAQNNPVPTYAGTVNLTTSDAKATLSVTSITFKPVAPSANAPVTFTATFGTAGTESITASDSVNSSLTGTVSTNVVAPDVATHFGLMLPSNVGTGLPVTVGIVPLDAKNNPVPTYAGTVNLTTSDSKGTLSTTSITFKPGAASAAAPVTFSVTFETTGSQSVTATDSSNSSLTGIASTTVAAAKVVTPTVATHFALLLPPNAPNGVPVTVGIVALDVNNNPVPTYTGTVNLSSSDSKATLSASSITFQANTPTTFTVTFATAGSQSVTATDSNTSSITGTASTTVAAADVATHFGFQLPSNVPSGSPVTIGVVALDAQNQVVPNYSGSVIVGSSDGSATLPTGAVTFKQGNAQFQVTFATAGAQTLTVTDRSNSSLTSTENIEVVLPKKIAPPPPPPPPTSN